MNQRSVSKAFALRRQYSYFCTSKASKASKVGTSTLNHARAKASAKRSGLSRKRFEILLYVGSKRSARSVVNITGACRLAELCASGTLCPADLSVGIHCSIRQHTSAYVSMRQQTCRLGSTVAYVSIRQHSSSCVSRRVGWDPLHKKCQNLCFGTSNAS